MAAARARANLRRERTERRRGVVAAQAAYAHTPADAFVGRQPLFDHRLDVVGYEIVLRCAPDLKAVAVADVNRDTSDAILNTFTDVDLEKILGGKRALISLTCELILEGIPTLLPPERVIVEVVETSNVDDRLIASLHRLRRQGNTSSPAIWLM